MPAAAAKPSLHRWSFYRAGGVDQVRLDRGADVLALDQLDLKLWIALSCPVRGLELDPRTLELLDTDGDGHVRPPEILAAVRWLRDVLTDADCLLRGEDGVALANLRQDTAEGRTLRASAQHILHSLGKDAARITIADSQQTAEVFAKGKRNGDGVVPPDTVDDGFARAVANDVVACMGGLPDRSGKLGFDRAQLDAFFTACTEHDEWTRIAEADAATVLPFGAATAAAWAATNAVRAKVDDWFGRCRLAAYDPRALAAVNREEAAYMAVAAQDLTITADEVAPFPLALVVPGQPLPLVERVNPAWASRLAALRAACCPDRDVLAEADWIALCECFHGYEAWLGRRGGAAVQQLGIARVREILAGDARAVLQRAIDDDLAVAGEVEAMQRVERLARLHRDFHKLLNNYVAFTDFYARRGAIFQAGTLYLDGRACDMCFHVHDAGKHAKMAPLSNSYLAYVDCTRAGGDKTTIAAAFTAGDSDNLFEGRNGVFFDRQGRDWDATISRIVSNPISVRQAFWSPYKKVLRGVQEMVAKRAAEADTAAGSRLTSGALAAGDAVKTGTAPTKKIDVGTVAALGVAISGITGVFTALLIGFLDLGPWIPIGMIGIVLAISGPAMLIAWLKLRQRNLGPILDANGWAVNTLTRVNIPLGGSLTALPKMPPGSSRSLVDPYAPKKRLWPRLLLALLVLLGIAYGLYRTNLLHRWFPEWIPAHHTDVDLRTKDGAKKVVQGGTVVFEVRNGAAQLFVLDADSATHVMPPIPVQNGTATLTIPADMEPRTLRISDGGDPLEIEVDAKPDKK